MSTALAREAERIRTEPPEPFQTMSYYASLAAQQDPYVIDGFVHSGSTIVAGRPMSGKTTFAANMAAAIARGDDEFLGHKVNRHGTVMVVSTDAGEARSWGKRMAGYGVGQQTMCAPYASGNWGMYIEAVRQVRPALFVLDNISNAIKGGDLNSSADTYRVIEPLDKIIAMDIPVLALAHSSKRPHEDGTYSKSPMGSTVWDAWDRHTVHVEPTGQNNLKVHSHGNESAPFELDLSLTWNDDKTTDYRIVGSEHATDKRPRKDETHDRRLAVCEQVLTEDRFIGVLQKDAAHMLGISPATLSRNLNAGGVRYDKTTGRYVRT